MRWLGLGAVLALLAIAAAGCGGSNGTSGDTTNPAAIETTALTDTSGVDTTATDPTETDTSETDPTTDTSETDTTAAGGLSGTCQDLVEASTAFSEAAGNAANPSGSLDATAEAFDRIVATAPAELKDDFEALAGVVSEYAKAVKDLNLEPGEVPSAAQIAELAQFSLTLGSEKVQQASAAIASWIGENCSPTP